MSRRKRSAGRPSTASDDNVVHLIRTRYGMTLSELAERTGIPIMTLQGIEQGGNTSLRNLITLSNKLGISLDALTRNVALGTPVPNDMLCLVEASFAPQYQMKSQLLRAQNGSKGEMYVLEQELAKLAGTRYEGFASAKPSKNPYNGYDILSSTVDGQLIMIEVKSTKAKKADTPFTMSANEVRRMKKAHARGEAYVVARVYDVNDPQGPRHVVYRAEELLNEFDFEPTGYRVRRKKSA